MEHNWSIMENFETLLKGIISNLKSIIGSDLLNYIILIKDSYS